MITIPKPTQEDALKIIKQVVTSVEPQASVYLFGSRARQDNAYTSDYDLLVVIPEKYKDDWEKRSEIRGNINEGTAENFIPIDILVECQSVIDLKKTVPGNIFRTIMREGILL